MAAELCTGKLKRAGALIKKKNYHLCIKGEWNPPVGQLLMHTDNGNNEVTTVLFHSIPAPCVTRYQLAEILILAGPTFERDIQIFSAGRV